MNLKKYKFKKWLAEHKKPIITSGIFLMAGLGALLVGFEIQHNWHLIRDWLNGPHATTFFILLIISLFVLSLILLAVGMKREE